MKRAFDCDEWEIRQLLQQRQCANVGLRLITVDVIAHQIVSKTDDRSVDLNGALGATPLPNLARPAGHV